MNRPQAAASRLSALVDRALAVRSRRAPRVAYAVAALLFLGAASAGFAALPDRTGEARPALLLLIALVLGPATSVCNAAEYGVLARYAGVRVRALEAIGVATLATAANLLPLPGSVLVRASALRRRDAAYSRVASALVAASGAWLATTALLTGAVMLAVDGRRTAGSALLVTGTVGVIIAHRVAGGHRLDYGVRVTGLLVAIELAKVATGALRLWLCITALGYDADIVQVAVLTFAPVLASAVGVIPGGLGLREAIAATLGPLVALPAAVAAAATALDRLLGMPIVLLVAARFALTSDDAAEAASTDVEVDAALPRVPL